MHAGRAFDAAPGPTGKLRSPAEGAGARRLVARAQESFRRAGVESATNVIPRSKIGALHDDRALLRRLGITRIARVTGLDRSGIEVACAVRPLGHVLQVCNGKGETFAEAGAGALLEAAELWGAERIEPGELAFGSREELGGRFSGEVWDATDLGSAGAIVAPGLWSQATRCAWREGVELLSGTKVLVPARALHCPPPGAPPLGPAVVAWSSNGSGAHPNRSAALLHALLEAAERDQLARALPSGFVRERIAQTKIAPRSLAWAAPRTARAVEALASRGFDTYLFDLSAPGPLALPVAGALLAERQKGPLFLTAGYACALERDEALLRALLEAVQSRLTDIHGAREDVRPPDRGADEALLASCRERPARFGAERMPQPRLSRGRGAARDVRAVLSCLKAAGFARAAAFELAPRELPIHIVKVVVPGMRVSELL